MKTCLKCGKLKDESEFYVHKTSHDGLHGQCKDCKKLYSLSNKKDNREKYKAYNAAYALLPHVIDKRKEYRNSPESRSRNRSRVKRYKEKNPIKHAAHIECTMAINAGKLVRMPCEICGHEEVQAHHDDYNYPLSVRWLYRKHHAEWHRHNKAICQQQISGVSK